MQYIWESMSSFMKAAPCGPRQSSHQNRVSSSAKKGTQLFYTEKVSQHRETLVFNRKVSQSARGQDPREDRRWHKPLLNPPLQAPRRQACLHVQPTSAPLSIDCVPPCRTECVDLDERGPSSVEHGWPLGSLNQIQGEGLVAEGGEVVLDAVDEAVHRDLTTTHSHGRGEQRRRA